MEFHKTVIYDRYRRHTYGKHGPCCKLDGISTTQEDHISINHHKITFFKNDVKYSEFTEALPLF